MLQVDVSIYQRLKIFQLLLIDHLFFSTIYSKRKLVDLLLGLNQWPIIWMILWCVLDQLLEVELVAVVRV